ncbi:hypothetical protein J8273_5930 [Carpediemonas membranifera]|uniref:Uncharacterized protein n=1 Tax=Carpediemonas membranifera TaxID=201153 RepID=A0A8J6B4E2_9EUKA|nr:hypothetical protein J8273_5930 [Carpediemonas membranifera]|eukprot:KAG9392672.1 hypothetical protein J8273_5930 [Carpediemonas membranifera]
MQRFVAPEPDQTKSKHQDFSSETPQAQAATNPHTLRQCIRAEVGIMGKEYLQRCLELGAIDLPQDMWRPFVNLLLSVERESFLVDWTDSSGGRRRTTVVGVQIGYNTFGEVQFTAEDTGDGLLITALNQLLANAMEAPGVWGGAAVAILADHSTMSQEDRTTLINAAVRQARPAFGEAVFPAPPMTSADIHALSTWHAGPNTDGPLVCPVAHILGRHAAMALRVGQDLLPHGVHRALRVRIVGEVGVRDALSVATEAGMRVVACRLGEHTVVDAVGLDLSQVRELARVGLEEFSQGHPTTVCVDRVPTVLEYDAVLFLPEANPPTIAQVDRILGEAMIAVETYPLLGRHARELRRRGLVLIPPYLAGVSAALALDRRPDAQMREALARKTTAVLTQCRREGHDASLTEGCEALAMTGLITAWRREGFL